MAVGKSLTIPISELLALFYARGMLKPLRDTVFYQDLEKFFRKIEALFDKKTLEYLGEVSESVHFEAGPRWALGLDPETLETVRSACEEGHQLQVFYQGANGSPARVRRLGPHFLYFAKGSLYLVATDLGAAGEAQKTFAVTRMRDAVRLEAEFNAERVSPEDYFKDTFGVYRATVVQPVRLQFEGPAAAFVKDRRWHDSQQLIQLEDGAIEMRLSTGVTPELIHWVLGFGSRVLVIEPETLAAAVRAEADRVLARYQAPRTERTKKLGKKIA